MKRLLRLFGWGLLLLIVAGVVLIGLASEWKLRRSYASISAPAPTLQGDAQRGRHWATILGCNDCHGRGLDGNVLDHSWALGRLVAPNLTLARGHYGDAALARAIRYGVKYDDNGIWVMPANAFYHLDEQTVADLIAFVRAVPDSPNPLPPTTNGPLLRYGMLFRSDEFSYVVEHVDRKASRLGDLEHAAGAARGRYIATVACGECHGLEQQGNPEHGVPDLAVVKAYSMEEFSRLMKTGIAKGGRDVGFMSRTARNRFVALDDNEVAALKAYLDVR